MLPFYDPMIPRAGPPTLSPGGWIYEETVDGWRILAYKDGDASAWGAGTAWTTAAGSATSPPRSGAGCGVP